MGRIVNTTYMTLDGDITNMQDWHFDYLGDESLAAAQAQLYGSDALIMGRATYDGFFPAWSAQAGDEFADRMNGIRKYVVSSTLQDPEWTNTSVINGDDVVEQIRRIKADTERDILQYGFGSVTRLMLANGLVDEVRIWLHPVLSGKAAPSDLLYRDLPQTRFTLGGVETHRTGMVILSYSPA
ncbi:dihydrofolate reductase family protein [Actinocrispum wychmicini]|uniref:Dihydrofolate reductase n=1 Tax=Actinocrispum wychmicini TaxID=1213861 RepID=A0A4R2JR25_9PSEU|nr:dihydrofolate reductase family protein [Actinocrispum wychmicini]TCO62701.1 dihydrofolate reductase [Actinocrispum wychmicini]